MAIFFFVVGLEIRREIHDGELSDLRRAALPLAAALGGMLVPALIYTAFNAGRPTLDGWGIPMATDIAFAVGVLTLLGSRVPPALRILLLALAVIDDVGAILVIALLLLVGHRGGRAGRARPRASAACSRCRRSGCARRGPTSLPALVTWGGAYAGGVHPTLAGVVVGLLTPVEAWLGPGRFAERRARARRGRANGGRARDALHVHLDGLARARREALSPVERLQHALHGWVAFGIMPLFALANAGVALGSASFSGDGLAVFAGVGLGLVVGKLVGIVAFAWLAVRARPGRAPDRRRLVAASRVVGLVGGIGFTMALFIAELALPPGPLLETAKLAILGGSLLSAVVALAVGKVALSPRVSLHEASAAEH